MTNCLIFKNIKFGGTDKNRRNIKIFLKVNRTRQQSLKALSQMETRKIAKQKVEKYFEKALSFELVTFVNNNAKVITRMLLSLLENFRNIRDSEGDSGFLEHFSPILREPLSILIKYTAILTLNTEIILINSTFHFNSEQLN